MGYIVFLIIFALIPGYVIYETSGYKINVYDDSGGAGLFPSFIAWFMLLLIIIQIIRTLINKEKKPVVFTTLFSGTSGIFLALMIIYVFLLRYLGFIISTCIFLIISSGYMYYKAKGKLITWRFLLQAAGYICFSILIFVFFKNALHIVLPVGNLGI